VASFTLLHVVTLALSGWGLTRPAGLFQFPALVGLVFIGFVLPQLYGLHASNAVPESALQRTELMSSMCGVMCVVGYQLAKRPRNSGFVGVDMRRMERVIAILTAISAISHIFLMRLPKEVLFSPWSGEPVAYNFFAQCLVYSFALCGLVFAETRSRSVFSLYVLNGAIYLWKIIFMGRRGSTAEFLLIIVLSEWFRRGRKPSNTVILCGVAAALLFSGSIASYRELVSNDEGISWEAIRQIDFLYNVASVVEAGGPELTNAAYDIEAAANTGEYDFGAFHWNALIFTNVPAQVVGPDLKAALLLDVRQTAREAYGHEESSGSTSTGIADAFRSFGYFGCFKFLGIGYLMGWFYRSALLGNWRHQVLVMILTTPAIHTITHHTHWILAPWVHMMIFLFPALAYATHFRPRRGSEAPRGIGSAGPSLSQGEVRL
jgi:hypothetical protein